MEMIACACGCGNLILERDAWGRRRKYIKWHWGKMPKSGEWKKKMSQSLRGPANGMWKDDGISLKGIHRWVNRNKPKLELCEICGLVPPLDLANVSGEYRRDIDDYRWLCRRCHMKTDGRLEALHKMNFARRRRGSVKPHMKYCELYVNYLKYEARKHYVVEDQIQKQP